MPDNIKDVIVDLFGNTVPAIVRRGKRGFYDQYKVSFDYRPSTDPDMVECCKWCIHSMKAGRGSKKFLKCANMGVSGGSASDVKVDYVCEKWAGGYSGPWLEKQKK